MSTVTARVTGTVLLVEHREGIARATGNAYSMDIARILVADKGLIELVIPRDQIVPSRGDVVDYLVDLSIRVSPAGQSSLQINILSVWPEYAAA